LRTDRPTPPGYVGWPVAKYPPERVRSHVQLEGNLMNSIVYLVGAVVIILAVLSFFGMR